MAASLMDTNKIQKRSDLTKEEWIFVAVGCLNYNHIKMAAI
jgi:hypothetical protein